MGKFSAGEMLVWNAVGGPRGRLGCLGPCSCMPSACPSFSALHHAALNGNTELITLLLEAQAAVDIKDNKGKAARDLRAQLGVSATLGSLEVCCPSTEALAQGLSLG